MCAFLVLYLHQVIYYKALEPQRGDKYQTAETQEWNGMNYQSTINNKYQHRSLWLSFKASPHHNAPIRQIRTFGK